MACIVIGWLGACFKIPKDLYSAEKRTLSYRNIRFPHMGSVELKIMLPLSTLLKLTGRNRVQLHAFLTSTLGGGESTSRSGHFAPTKRTSSTHWTGVCGPQTKSRHCREEKILLPLPRIESLLTLATIPTGFPYVHIRVQYKNILLYRCPNCHPRAWQLSRDIPANAGSLCNEAAVLRDTIKETSCMSLANDLLPQ